MIINFFASKRINWLKICVNVRFKQASVFQPDKQGKLGYWHYSVYSYRIISYLPNRFYAPIDQPAELRIIDFVVFGLITKTKKAFGNQRLFLGKNQTTFLNYNMN